jgi:hypothetical protein
LSIEISLCFLLAGLKAVRDDNAAGRPVHAQISAVGASDEFVKGKQRPRHSGMRHLGAGPERRRMKSDLTKT